MNDKYYSAQDIMDQAIGTDAYFQIKSILTSLVPADVVPRAAYDQIAWERDLAVQQLREDYGVGLGEKKPDKGTPVKCCDCVYAVEDGGWLFCEGDVVEPYGYCSQGRTRGETGETDRR